MLFADITILDQDLAIQTHQYVGVRAGRIAYLGATEPQEDYGERYPGQGRLLLPGFYNTHAHTPMTLLRGYGENLPLQRWLHERIFPFEAQMRGEDIYWGTMLGLAESLRFGVVATSDMYYHCPEIAAAVLQVGAKNNLSSPITCFGEEDLDQLDCFRAAEEFLRTYQGKDSRLITDLALHAEYTSTPKVVAQLAAYAKQQGVRLQVHVSETRQEVADCQARHGKTPPQYLADLGLFDLPTTAAHCVWLEEDDFALLCEKGVVVASCPVSNLKLASGFCNLPKLLEQGVNVTIGTDSVASNNSLNYLEEMKFFSVVHKGSHLDPTVITPKETLLAATRGGALAQGRLDCGALAVGYRADLLVLDIDQPNMQPVHNLLNNIVYSAAGGDIRLTMVDGQVLYRDGQYLTLDIEQVLYQADRATQAILKRL